jgi:hypothetical protein
MNSSQNSASRRSNTSASLSSKEKLQSKMKLQGLLVIMIINAATPSQCTTSIPIFVGHQKIGIRISDPLRKKEAKALSTKGQISIINEGAHQAEATVAAEGHTPTSLRTACSMAVKSTIIQKIVPYSSSLKGIWSKTLSSLRDNHRLGRSTIPCNGLPITTNTLHLTLHFFHNKPTKTAKSKLRLITSHITMPQPITLNLRQLHK